MNSHNWSILPRDREGLYLLGWLRLLKGFLPGNINIRFFMSDENESIHFKLKFLKRCNFLCGLDMLIVKVIQDSNCSQYNQNARSDLLVDLTVCVCWWRTWVAYKWLHRCSTEFISAEQEADESLRYMLICLYNQATSWLNILVASELYHIKHNFKWGDC